MLPTKTKEHMRRWAALKLPKYGALLGGLAALGLMVAWTGRLMRVVTVTDTRGDRAVLITAVQDVHTLLEQAGISPLAADDEFFITDAAPGSQELRVLRAYTVPVTADGQTQELVTTGGTVAELLAEAGITPGPDDLVEPALDAEAGEGCAITLRRVAYNDYTQEEIRPAETQYVETSLFYRSQSYTQTVQEGSDGLDLVRYRETWIDGELTAAEETGRETLAEMIPNIIKCYGEEAPVSRFVGPEVADGVPVEGVAAVYSGQRATGYSASATAKGASGRRLTYGTVAVNPNVIPYGSLLYITSDDGRFVYGYAYAADTGTAMMEGHAFIDLYYETYAESVKNAVISVTVYVLDDETAAQYKEQNDALLEADTFPGL